MAKPIDPAKVLVGRVYLVKAGRFPFKVERLEDGLAHGMVWMHNRKQAKHLSVPLTRTAKLEQLTLALLEDFRMHLASLERVMKVAAEDDFNDVLGASS